MSSQPKNLKLTTDQREFVLERLAADMPYTEIISDFTRMYPYVCEAYDPEVFRTRLYDQLRKLKSDNKNSDTSTETDGSPSHPAGQPLIPITNPYYRLRYLDKLLHETPALEVVSEGTDSNGNPYQKKKSNRADIIKMLELAERIFEKMLGIEDAEVRSEMPKLIQTDAFGTASVQEGSEVSDANS